MLNKRKHTTLPLKDKLTIINMLDNGHSLSAIANKFKIGRTTVHDLKRRRLKILQLANDFGERKTLKFGKFPDVDSTLYDWFLEERVKQKPVNGDTLKEKAKEIYFNKTRNEFKASSGWLDRFKKRFGIRFNVSLVSSEKSSFKSRDEEVINKFIEGFKEKVDQLGLIADQLYCSDTSALFWRVLKINTEFSTEDTPKKPCEDRITFMPCSNSTGTHKLNLLVIGKESSEVFKVVPFPVTYKYQPNGWLNKEIFTEWFHDEFVPDVRSFMRRNNLPEKALLVLDEAPGYPEEHHLKSNDWMIQAIFIPPEVSRWIQPMGRNLMQVIKDRFKKKILLDIVSKGENIQSNLININLNNAIFALVDSWKSLSSAVIRTSWKILGSDIISEYFFEDEEDDDTNIDDLLVAFRGSDIKEKDIRDWLAGNTDKVNVFITIIKPEDPLRLPSTSEDTELNTNMSNVEVKEE